MLSKNGNLAKIGEINFGVLKKIISDNEKAVYGTKSCPYKSRISSFGDN